MPHQRSSRAVVLIAVVLSQSACYYAQAARGQYDVLRRSEPIDEVLAADSTPDELARQLALVQEARQFAVDELLLPDNDSYRSYADLGRDYVVWNVFAAPEFSLQARTWCFPVAGCVAYRGYFDEQDARRKAAQLQDAGFDVAVGGVPAYSTLGRFDDPVLNTMLHWQDTDLVATIFHELAHQVLYIKDDTAFNESFATAVADIGLERWLRRQGESSEFDAYQERRRLREELVAIIRDASAELEALYDSPVDEDTMRAAKDARLRRLADDLQAKLAASGVDSPGWPGGPLNNARIASIGLYELDLGRFRALYEECGRELECFYDRASSLRLSESSSRR
ncbi:MAG: aminopeptidase [Woeseiaceae bacterium]|nr:aminopeptidase [Woeseiaceae bacterium]